MGSLLGKPLFDKKPWIGKGKKFPSNSFDFPGLEGYCEGKPSIPKDSYSDAFLENKVTVQDFLARKLPQKHYGLVHPSATACFLTSPPNDDIQQLATRARPLWNASGDKRFDH
jgi:hypothetical protein